MPIGSYGTLLSLPLKEGYGIDFTFASYPKVAIKYWGTPTAAGFIKWDNATQITPLSYTSNNAFFFRISDSGASPTQGLLANENILTLPYYETAGQTFNPTVNNYDVTRTTAAYQLANAEVTQSLVFAKDVILNSNFALAGNPFMSSIDFATLQTDHSTLIKSNYRLWDKSSSNYNVYSEDGVSISEIPTKTGFVVEQYDGADAIGSLVFPLALTATASSVSPAPQLTNNANKLFFTATNEYGTSPISVITKRPYGSDLFGNADAGMLLSETDIPQVYTLKPNAAGATVGAAINVISANNAIIPLAIKSDYNGATTLNFSGMDNYQDAIYLLDYTTGAEINLSQTAEYAYEFVNAGSSNSRFAIAIRQPVPTTIANNATDNILVLNLNGTIEIKSIDKIEQVQIFTATGALVYSSANGNTISTSLLPTGIYNIKVRTTKDIAVKKIKL
ncbi:MAG: T9SS type A sorting domain-containing protein [Prevotellaceae bacterium]|nr:T9SS type A sorting domain-containing protein [Prevotellaceae bacterium]